MKASISCLQKTWEELILVTCSIVSIENPDEGGITPSRNTGHRALLKFAAATRAISTASRFTPEPSEATTFYGYWSQANHKKVPSINPPTIVLWSTNSPLCRMDAAIPCSNKGVHSAGRPRGGGGWGGGGSSAHARGCSGSTQRRHTWSVSLSLSGDSEELEKAEQVTAAKAVTRGSFGVDGLLQLVNLLLLNPRWQAGLKAWGTHPLHLLSSSLQKTGALGRHWGPDWSAHCSGHWIGNRNDPWGSSPIGS